MTDAECNELKRFVTNWKEFEDPEGYAIVECFAPIGTIFKKVKS